MAPHTDRAHAYPPEAAMTARIRVYQPDEQQRIVESMYPNAVHRLTAKLQRDRARLWKLALHRGVTVGVQQYGDQSFLLGRSALDHEVDCELADGLYYEAIYAAKEAGIIPWEVDHAPE